MKDISSEWTHSQRKRYTCDYYEMYRTEPQ